MQKPGEQPWAAWAGWWRRSVAGAALAWTAVCVAFSAKRARSEILFMSSCHSNSSMLGRFSQRCLKWVASDDHDAWLLLVRALPHNQNPDTIKAPATETCHWDYWLHPTHKKTSDSWAFANKVRRTWACHRRLLALMLPLGSHGCPLERREQVGPNVSIF